ncbi:kinase-like domain-containing protein [Penicillium crustosum]|uniref:kinase-like domain-containing protein n=1 Tax=Penicillium crustosum TaxID=36656 RepID=UPI00238CDED4|nr:kinase-like domain-containing protein [Penicillium crustosum]KAJ5419275.1 kinase-like domain-containing protein [Penicillium crustosum]
MKQFKIFCEVSPIDIDTQTIFPLITYKRPCHFAVVILPNRITFITILASVFDLCNESVRIYLDDEGSRDVFALGGFTMTRPWGSLIEKWLAWLAGTRLEKFIVQLDCMILHFGKIYVIKMPLLIEG